MEVLKYFFRTQPDGIPFQTFSTFHISILIFCIISSFILFNKVKKNRKFELIIGFTLIVQQVSLYTWYFINNYNVLREGLPLYHCRIAILTLAFGLLFNKDSLLKFGAIWGIVGSFFALLFPSPDPFLFPHITNVSFFIGHIPLLLGCIYTLWIKNVHISKSSIRNILRITNIYCILMFVLNSILGSNYGYMNHSPIPIPIDLNPVSYALLAITVTNLLMVIMYLLYNQVKSKKGIEELSNILENELELETEIEIIS